MVDSSESLWILDTDLLALDSDSELSELEVDSDRLDCELSLLLDSDIEPLDLLDPY